MTGKLRVAVIGSEMRHPNTPMAYTVYRTSVNYQGFCYHRLIRFRHFRSFSKHLKLSSNAPRITAKVPPKIWWSRKASLRPETVEARQVLLNEYMQQVSTRPMTQGSGERLRKLLKVGEFAPEEEEDRVINSRLSTKQRSVTLTDPTSDRNPSFQSDVLDQESKSDNEQSQKSLTDEGEDFKSTEHREFENHIQDVQRETSDTSSESASDDSESHPNQSMSESLTSNSQKRRNSRASTDPVSDEEPLPDHLMSAPLKPEQLGPSRPVNMSLTAGNSKHVMFEPSKLNLKDDVGDSIDNLVDNVSTPEHNYKDQIIQCIASIEEIMDDSRKLEARICENQVVNKPMEGKVMKRLL